MHQPNALPNSWLTASGACDFNSMQGIQNNQIIFAENMKSHIKAIQDVGNATQMLKEEVIHLRKVIDKNEK